MNAADVAHLVGPEPVVVTFTDLDRTGYRSGVKATPHATLTGTVELVGSSLAVHDSTGRMVRLIALDLVESVEQTRQVS